MKQKQNQPLLDEFFESIVALIADLIKQLWIYRFELLTGGVCLAGWLYFNNRSDARTATILLVLLLLCAAAIPQIRRPFRRIHHSQRVKREWTRAVIDSGAADPPPKRSRKAYRPTGSKAVKVKQVPTGDLLNVRIGRGTTVANLQEREAELASCLSTHFRPVASVRIGPDPQGRANRATALIIRRDPFKDQPSMAWSLVDAPQTSVWDAMPFGLYEDGEPVLLHTMGGHVLIAGVTGAGKSVAMHVLVAHAALDPSAHIVLLDNKQVDLAAWEPVADQFIGPNIRDAVTTLRAVQVQMQKRYDDLLGNRVRKIQPGEPTTTVFIDELAFYLLHEDKEQRDAFNSVLLDLLQRGRAAGIRIVAATQRPSAEIINTNLRAQFSHRIAFRVMEAETTQMILGSRDAAAHLIPRKGSEGVGFIGGEADHPRRFRTPYISEEEVDKIAERAMELRTGQAITDFLGEHATPPKEKKEKVPTAAKVRADSNRQALLDLLPEYGEGLTRAEIKEKTGRPDQEMWPVLKALIADDKIVRDGGGKKGDPYRYRLAPKHNEV